MKQVGRITGKQFGFLYIQGIPYNPTKIKRFLDKGAGIKLQDLVIFEDEGDRVLSYIKNAIYADGKEIRMVKEFVRSEEMAKAKMSDFSDVSDQIRKELAEEGMVITNEGVFVTPAQDENEPVSMNVDSDTEIGGDMLDILLPDMKRQVAIILQSCLQRATDIAIVEAKEGEPVDRMQIRKDALDMMFWVDRNSLGMFTSPYVQKVKK